MFALAANGFNKPSETFIRSHARHLAPGRTLLIAERRGLRVPIDAPLIIYSKRLPVLVRQNASTAALVRSIASPARFLKSRDAYLASIMQDFGVQTLMAEYGPTAVNLLEATRIAGCRLYVHFHGVDASKMLNDAGIVQNYQKLFAQAEGVIAPSRYLADNLANLGCPVEKLYVVPCGVEIEASKPTVSERQHLLSVGRFTEKKSPISTIAAFALVKKDFPEATLEMMGNGPLYAEAENEVKRLNLQQSVSLPGIVTPPQVQAAMRRSRIFLQHSVTANDGDIEGLPVAILEAMAAGLPVVSTLHSGIPEAVVDGDTGFLVPEFDVEGMAAKIVMLLNNPKMAESFGQKGHQRVSKEFSRKVTIQKLQTIMNL
jgi:glycosyltransferase involved in cell wall biosynthesis